MSSLPPSPAAAPAAPGGLIFEALSSPLPDARSKPPTACVKLFNSTTIFKSGKPRDPDGTASVTLYAKQPWHRVLASNKQVLDFVTKYAKHIDQWVLECAGTMADQGLHELVEEDYGVPVVEMTLRKRDRRQPSSFRPPSGELPAASGTPASTSSTPSSARSATGTPSSTQQQQQQQQQQLFPSTNVAMETDEEEQKGGAGQGISASAPAGLSSAFGPPFASPVPPVVHAATTPHFTFASAFSSPASRTTSPYFPPSAPSSASPALPSTIHLPQGATSSAAAPPVAPAAPASAGPSGFHLNVNAPFHNSQLNSILGSPVNQGGGSMASSSNSTTQSGVSVGRDMTVVSGQQAAAAASGAAVGANAQVVSPQVVGNMDKLLAAPPAEFATLVPPPREPPAVREELITERDLALRGVEHPDAFQQALLSAKDTKIPLTRLAIQQVYRKALSVVHISVLEMIPLANGGKDIRRGVATGFLVSLSPQWVLMTNHHVFPRKESAKLSVIRFDFVETTRLDQCPCYELDPEQFFLNDATLDVAFVAVKPQARRNGNKLQRPVAAIPLVADRAGHRLYDSSVHRLCIIQHPRGRPQEISFCGDLTRVPVAIDGEGPHTLAYMVDTESGSSGSPVFNVALELQAIHTSAVAKYADPARTQVLLKGGGAASRLAVFGGTGLDGKPIAPTIASEQVQWDYNFGTLISAVYSWLEKETIPVATRVSNKSASEADKSKYVFLWHLLAGDAAAFIFLDDIIQSTLPA